VCIFSQLKAETICLSSFNGRLKFKKLLLRKTTIDINQQAKHDVLSSLKIGEQAEVVGISPNCRGQQRRRLMDLGIVPGSNISAVMKSASGDPVGYRVMGTTIGIRKQHADQVFINLKN